MTTNNKNARHDCNGIQTPGMGPVDNDRKRTSTPVAAVLFALTVAATGIGIWIMHKVGTPGLIVATVFGCAAVVFGVWVLLRLVCSAVSALRQSLRTSNQVFLTLVTWFLTATVCLLYGFIGTIYATACIVMFGLAGLRRWQTVFVVVAAVLVFLMCTLCAAFGGLCATRGWDRTGQARRVSAITLLVLFFLLVTYLSHDAAPIQDDYTLADIPCPSENVDESQKTILTFRKGGDKLLRPGLPHQGSAELYTNALMYSTEIEEAWDHIAEGRRVIERLDAFEAVADLAEPDYDTPIISFVAYRNISQTYWAFCALRTAQGKPAEAAEQLGCLHSVMRKTAPYSRTLVRKMICVAIMNGNIRTAHRILKSPACGKETVAILKSAFPRLSDQDVGMRGPMICEYLCAKKLCETYGLSDLVYVLDWRTPKRSGESLCRRALSAVVLPITLNRNTTIRQLRTSFDLTIAGAGKHPPDMSEANRFLAELRDRAIGFKNILGYGMLATMLPNFSKAAEHIFECRISSDLLAIEISAKSGEVLNLTDGYTGREYVLDATSGLPSSAGPDGEFGTDDDINLDGGP